jgi:hypothetical protein
VCGWKNGFLIVVSGPSSYVFTGGAIAVRVKATVVVFVLEAKLIVGLDDVAVQAFAFRVGDEVTGVLPLMLTW